MASGKGQRWTLFEATCGQPGVVKYVWNLEVGRAGMRGTVLAHRDARDPQNAGRHEEAPMKRAHITKESPKVRLAVKKETLKDLSPKQDVRGGFIMKDTIIIPTSRR